MNENDREVMTALLSEIERECPNSYTEIKDKVESWEKSLGEQSAILIIPYLRNYLRACKDPEFAEEFFNEKEPERERKKTVTGIPPEFENVTIEDVRHRDGVEGFDECLELTRGYLGNIEERIFKGQGLSFHGDVGMGKTMFASIVARRAAECGYSAYFTTVRDMMDTLKTENYSSFMEYLLDVDVLVLDDIGAEYTTAFSRAEIDHIIANRHAKKLVTIITSNFTPYELEKRLEDRITDRLEDRNNICVIEGLSYRKLRKHGDTPTPPKPRKKDVAENLKEEIKAKKEDKVFPEDSYPYMLSVRLRNRILDNRPNARVPESDPKSIAKWAKVIDLMIRRDHRDPKEIARVIDWCQDDDFWHSNILSTANLREHFDQLAIKMENEEGG